MSGIVSLIVYVFRGNILIYLQPVFCLQDLLWLLSYEIGLRETYKWMELSRLKKLALHALLVVVIPIVSLIDCLPAFTL